MEFKTYTVLTLLVCSSSAFAWQPLTYPVRSQSPYERSIDTATCYAVANKTGVNITHESQIPARKPAPTKTSSTGVPARPPLPPSTFSSAPVATSMPAAATEPGASAPVATAATDGAAAGASSVKSASAPGAGSEALAATSPASADGGASGAGSTVKLPPLPEPEPPMARYWAAYANCMQARGYVVAQ
jgi:hypothetical protein